jgi:hypothetical protein
MATEETELAARVAALETVCVEMFVRLLKGAMRVARSSLRILANFYVGKRPTEPHLAELTDQAKAKGEALCLRIVSLCGFERGSEPH